ncbi:hypothetical protein, partial [Pseudolysinimonas sp.]
MAWSDQAAEYLRGSTSCPRCERGPVGPEHCPFCGAILVGEVAEELATVSAAAAELLDQRAAIIARLRTTASLAPPPTGAPAAAAPAAAAAPVAPAAAGAPATAARAPSSTVSLQSVLAIMGAVLLAVAILVFRFSNTGVELPVRQVVI